MDFLYVGVGLGGGIQGVGDGGGGGFCYVLQKSNRFFT